MNKNYCVIHHLQKDKPTDPGKFVFYAEGGAIIARVMHGNVRSPDGDHQLLWGYEIVSLISGRALTVSPKHTSEDAIKKVMTALKRRGWTRVEGPKATAGIDPAELTLTEALDMVAKHSHESAKKNGWWEGVDPKDRFRETVGLMLVVTELAEAVEILRTDPHAPDKHLPQFRAIEVEYADAILRLLDQAEGRGYRVAKAAIAKIAYNHRRADHQPKNRAKPGGKAF